MIPIFDINEIAFAELIQPFELLQQPAMASQTLDVNDVGTERRLGSDTDSEAAQARGMLDLQASCASCHDFTLRKLVQSSVFGFLKAFLLLGRAFRLYCAILWFPVSVNNVSISDTSLA
ncbi:PREDICTED: uncharacterized protein LOC104605307 [Nelumbo nucifera]|uniref:Uncharacterized protein LOC104605307 n=1 Tax=Nelumbo nucifera TaxID=4432 RepID=A0A1U8AYY9_NELNU|nr:PREDICTED: uncharacterized protein LOC104605307 [Nelumbo nucifera]